MATFSITGPDGGQYEIDAPDERSAISALRGLGGAKPAAVPAAPAEPVDPIRAQVRSEIDAARAKGIPMDTGGLPRRMVQGATMGAADEILAGLSTPFEMIKRGTFSPVEGYNYAKTREDLLAEDARKSQGLLGHLAEGAGGLSSGVGLLRAGVTAAPRVAAAVGDGLLGTSAGMATDAAVMGGVQGFNEGSGADRLTGAAKGAVIGGAVGGALPLGVAAASTAAAPVTSYIRATANPTAFAERQVARKLSDSGQSIDDIAFKLQRSADEGQGVYRMADAMGNEGARMAAVVAKNPGPGREILGSALETRQAGQGKRIAGQLSAGFETPQTAAQTEAALAAARKAADDRAFSAIRNEAEAVNVAPVIERIDQTLRPGVSRLANPADHIAADSVEAALGRARSLLTDGRSQVTDFEVVQRARGDIADAIGKATRAGENNKARLLTQVRNELDAQMEAASEGYRNAMAQSARAAKTVEAVDTGRTAASRGRTEDIIPAFRAMRPQEQQAFRAGYVDPYIASLQGGRAGNNKAAQFTADAFKDEAAAIASPRTGATMTRQLDRENEMFRTYQKALGGSSTAENLADNAGMGIDPAIIGHLMSGNVLAAGGNLARRAGATLSGNTEAVREATARLLLMNSPAEVRQVIERQAALAAQNSNRGQLLGRGVLSAGMPIVSGLLGR